MANVRLGGKMNTASQDELWSEVGWVCGRDEFIYTWLVGAVPNQI